MRHPERYGPRAGNPNNLGGPGAQPQSRTGGLGRAIIDTFPIIKFGRTSEETAVSGAGATTGRVKDAGDLEGNAVGEGTRMEMRPMERNVSGEEEEEINVAPTHMDNAVEEGAVGATALGAAAAVATHSPHSSPDRSPSPSLPASTSIAKPASRSNDVVPEAIGRETCPICIVDFEVGDDLRVLPCPGKHRFHQECVDPWLLELSSSCPICRQGTYSHHISFIFDADVMWS